MVLRNRGSSHIKHHLTITNMKTAQYFSRHIWDLKKSNQSTPELTCKVRKIAPAYNNTSKHYNHYFESKNSHN